MAGTITPNARNEPFNFIRNNLAAPGRNGPKNASKPLFIVTAGFLPVGVDLFNQFTQYTFRIVDIDLTRAGVFMPATVVF